MLQGVLSPAIITWSGMPKLGKENMSLISNVVRGRMKGYGPIYEVEKKKTRESKVK
jgi:hypothetical protein